MSSQREQFCRLVALRGYTQTDAYREAYQSGGADHTCYVEASKLMANPEVALRIERLQRPELKEEILTKEGHLAVLARLRDEATGLGQLGPAVAAEQLRGKVSGFHIERNLNANARSLEELVAGADLLPDAGHDLPPSAKPTAKGGKGNR